MKLGPRSGQGYLQSLISFCKCLPLCQKVIPKKIIYSLNSFLLPPLNKPIMDGFQSLSCLQKHLDEIIKSIVSKS